MKLIGLEKGAFFGGKIMILLLFLNKNIRCGSLLEASQ